MTSTARPRPADLPNFEDPPVDEVAIGIAFLSIGTATSNHLAKFRDTVKHELPGLQYQPHMTTPLEKLANEDYRIGQPIGSTLLLPAAPPPAQRTWLVSADDQYLVQLQDDLFISNWRRRQDPYPHFESLFDLFWTRFTLFRSQVADDSELPLQLQQLEVTYVNWVPFNTAPLNEWFGPAQRAKIQVGGASSYPEHGMWMSSFLVTHEGIPLARLHARQLEALRPTLVPQIGAQLELTFRVPLAPGAQETEIIDLAYTARDTIVRAFTDLTTEEGHKRWRLTT